MIRRVAVLIVVVLIVAAAWQFGLFGYLSLDVLRNRWQELLAAYQAHPLGFLLSFFALYVIVTATSLPGATVLTLSAGALFGVVTGFLLASFASSIGATLAMLVARTLIGESVQARFPAQFEAVNRGIERDGPFYLLTLRLVPLVPFFVVNLVMGMTKIPVRLFYWVSQLGMAPATLIFVFAGTRIAAIGQGKILTPGLFVALSLLGVSPWIGRFLARWLGARRVYRGFKRPRTFDTNLLVIGAGSAGLISALIAATVRAKVTLVERNLMGGDCLNTGCVPSKTLIASANVAQQMRTAARFGITSVAPQVDFAAVMARVHEVIARITPKDSMARYRSLGVDCIAGDAMLIDPWTASVGEKKITARSIVIASGARPTVPPIPGLDGVRYVTSDNVWELRTLPERLVVLGGGPIGCELAQAFSRLGSKVAVVDMLDRILPKEDADVSEFMTRKFRAEGIEIYTSHAAARVEPGQLHLKTTDGAEVSLPFTELLLAVGRRPNTEKLGLQELGIGVARGGALEVDEFLATRFPNIYACGDVIGPYQFTHMAAHQAYYAAVNGLFRGFWRFKANYRVIPWATYTDPEVAQVGLNERAAKEQNVPYEVTRFGFDDLDRALAEGAEDGWIKVLTRPGKDEILGVTMVGAHAGELIAEAVLAMTHRLGLAKLMATIHIYPTLMEAHKLAAGQWRRARAPQRLLGYVAYFHGFLRGRAAS